VIDFHCHLDLYPEPQEMTRRCVDQGLYVLSVTNTPSAWVGTSALAAGASAKRIRTALGLHPQIAHQRKVELDLFHRLLPETRYVGEIGLDGAPEFKQYWSDQIMVFDQILEFCQNVGGRVLSIHSRRAASAVLDHLEARPGAGLPILHWFSGTTRELDRAVEMGCWFSVGPTMLASEKGRALATRMPRDQVLTESDGPFAQLRGQTVQPWDVVGAMEVLGTVWGEPAHEIKRHIFENLRRLTTDLLASPDRVDI
jgi:TatD DNase family protein